MPKIKSAKKRVRTSRVRMLRNRVRRERLRKAIKQFRTAVHGGEKTRIVEELKKATSVIDKSCTKGLIHKNTANRKKSRLAKAAHRVLRATGAIPSASPSSSPNPSPST